MQQDSLVEINICTPPELTDPIASFLVDQKSGGVLIEDISDEEALGDRKKMGWQWVRAYFPSERLNELRGLVTVYLSELQDVQHQSEPPFFDLRSTPLKDWGQAWKAFFKPIQVCQDVVVKPSWESVPRNVTHVLDIDPGMAFGMGSHPSTRQAAEAIRMVLCGMEDFTPTLGVFSALDVGTGSGILAMVAAKLGVPRILGIDIEAEAVRAARENVINNKLTRRIEIQGYPLDEVFETFDMVIANIIPSTLVENREELVGKLNPGGALILSGILRNQGAAVKSQFLKTRVEFVATTHEENWCALIFRKI